ncbi:MULTISPECIES: nucleopolyhedrovirus P10 family protein [Streptomyces]|nr:nucleopolyhedrovirus P10 family protein [Streptomyces ruber]
MDLNEVRRRLALGRVLPLGGPRDGAWITEQAAGPVLRDAAAQVRGVRLGRLRLSPARPDQPYDPAVPPPPSALPPGPLRVDAEFRAVAGPLAPAAEPLPAAASRLRTALAQAAAERLGLTVTEVDLRVTGLLDTVPEGDPDGTEPSGSRYAYQSAESIPHSVESGPESTGNGPDSAEKGPAPADETEPQGNAPRVPGDDEEARVAAAVLGVPGVTRLTGVLGMPARAIRIGTGAGTGTGPALPHRHVRVELAVTSARRTLEVARAVRTAAGEALPDRPSVAVLVTAVDPAAG